MGQVRFFASPDEFRAWLARHHNKLDEQWVGYYKKGSGLPSMSWPESVDVALCFGWIDGLRKSIDDKSYKIRFTPRRRRSRWSARNLGRMKLLIDEGLVSDAGLAVYRNRDRRYDEKPAVEVALPTEYEELFRADVAAWNYFMAARPSYRKHVIGWVMGGKKEDTRRRRLRILIESSAKGEVTPLLRWGEKKK